MGFHTREAPRSWARDVEPPLRRARLLAARAAPVGGIVRRGILSGQYDGGELVLRHLAGRRAEERGRKPA